MFDLPLEYSRRLNRHAGARKSDWFVYLNREMNCRVNFWRRMQRNTENCPRFWPWGRLAD